ncbi:hypothetical protein DSO57_1021562 [Entomophthora muscae]|uniref:Uncharacterized protein n=1 Tax=Entomophthora muscae TaxID=34485 RepID=A0ACC2U1X7_9FUNG|nr:hypothetical protein DSO57_1021562 [Entomophthora muscae]
MSFISKGNFDIVKEQYQELLQAQAADQGSTTAPVPSQLSQSTKAQPPPIQFIKCELCGKAFRSN